MKWIEFPSNADFYAALKSGDYMIVHDKKTFKLSKYSNKEGHHEPIENFSTLALAKESAETDSQKIGRR